MRGNFHGGWRGPAVMMKGGTTCGRGWKGSATQGGGGEDGRQGHERMTTGVRFVNFQANTGATMERGQ
jgi:hypothetical protein